MSCHSQLATRQLTQSASAIRLTVTPSSQRAAALGRRRSLRVQATKGGGKDGRRPVRIVLIRHGESEGNVDERVYRRTPDHRVQLTAKGHAQALKAGQALKELMGPDGRAYFYVSPYVRTLQTAQDIGSCLDRDQIAGVREEPRIREQDFGNLQDERMPVTKMQRNAYGRFFFRFPDGESAADVYDRVTGFRETLRQDLDFRFAKQDPDNLTLVIVTHGISLRVFLMRWYKYDFEQFGAYPYY